MNGTKLAILGLGSRTTLFYLNELNKRYHIAKGGYSTFPLILLNADFNTINPLLPQPSKALDTATEYYVRGVEKLEIKHILIPNITLHETIDRLVINKNVIHPIRLTISRIKKNKWSKIVLFGSLYTMQSPYIRNHFGLNNIDIILPSQKDMLLIDDIRKQVYSETETEELIKIYHLLIKKYTEISPVVLACTELSIFKPKQRTTNTLLDMAEIQINEAEKLIL